MPTVTVYSTRGGSGKTLISVNLAYWLAKEGHKTLIIDADIEAPSLDKILLSPESERSRTWVHYLGNSVEDLASVIESTKFENLDLISSPQPEVGQEFLSSQRSEWWAVALKRSIQAQKELYERFNYEWIIVDNQSGISMNSVNHMAIADRSLLVLRPANYGVDASFRFIKEMYNILKDVRERKDFYVWNQVPIPQNKEEETQLKLFMDAWDDFFQTIGLQSTVRMSYSHSVAISLISKGAGVFTHIPEFQKNIEKIAKQII